MINNREAKKKWLKYEAKRLVERYGKEESLKVCNESILEKYLSSTQTYWKDLKKEIKKL